MMRQLSPDDAAFLYADNEHSRANVTLVMIYDPSGAPRGRLGFKVLLQHVAARLHRSPMFRQRLDRVPLDLDLPYWIEDERFDLEYHVRHIALPEPGDWRQFCIQASRIHARALDLERPPWELYLVERLDSIDGLPVDSFALLLKVHHAALHGHEGGDLAVLLHDTTPDVPRPPPPEPWFPASPPATAEVLLRALKHNLSDPVLGPRPLARALASLAPRLLTFVGDALRHPQEYPSARFNAEVSPHRVFDSRRFEESQLAEICQLVRGATADDVVLAVCGGALRRYLQREDELPGECLVALAPLSLHGALGSDADWEAGLRRVPLATDTDSPLERLRRIVRHTAAERRRATAPRAARKATQPEPHAPAAVLGIAARALRAAAPAAGRGITIANCTIVNAPGPSAPLYLQGARMSYFSAMTPIADGLGLTIAVTSYDGRVLVSPTACREQLPDPERFAQDIRDCFEEYLALSRRPATPARRPARSAARRRAAARASS
jgi:WS/DGAT/MGAT family acyltransferase